MNLFGSNSDAVISDCGRYRYSLTRIWDDALPVLCWIMLNPSKADAYKDDPTVRRCIAFAKAWGYGGIVIVNLFALRATDPAELRRADDPIGSENDAYIDAAVGRAGRVVAAWGAHGGYLNRDIAVLSRIAESWCLKVTRGGFPGHPLYVSSKAILVKYWGRPAFDWTAVIGEEEARA